MLENLAKVKKIKKKIADKKNDSIPLKGASDFGIVTEDAAWRQIYSWAGAPPAQEGGLF